MEQWKPVVGYEGLYEVSSLGRVRSIARRAAHWRGGTLAVRERILKMPLVGHKWGGYPTVHLSNEGRKKTLYVHRLVATAFIGEIGNNEVNHINGVKTDNRVGNLEVISPAENLHHAAITGLRDLRGQRNHKAVLSSGDVRAIRERIASGHTLDAIASDYGVKWACISKIKNRRTWAHLP